MKSYLKLRKSEYAKDGIILKTNIIFSDRGPTDIWCAPFMAYACEIVNETGVALQPNTSGAGHGKWVYDAVGGCMAVYGQNGVRVGNIKFIPGKSIAGTMVEHYNANFTDPADGEITRHFHELHAADITVHKSPVDSLDINGGGITEYHCCLISINNQIKFRRTSCFCDKCINSDFGIDCDEIGYCGKWRDTKISKYPSYSEALPTSTETEAPTRKTNNRGRGRGNGKGGGKGKGGSKGKGEGRRRKRNRTALSTPAVSQRARPRKPRPIVVSVPLSDPPRKRHKSRHHNQRMNVNMNANEPPSLI